jgi:branched-chain amino acid transport system permease protein
VIAQLLTSGVVSGSIYALIGLGLTVGFKATDLITFAQGAMVLLGAYVGVLAAGPLALSYGWAVVASVVVVTIVGWVCDRLVSQRLVDAPHMTQVLATLAIANVIKGCITLLWGNGSHAFPPSGRMQAVVSHPVVVTGQQLVVVACSFLAMALLSGFFSFTRWGAGMRALSENRMGANLCGVRTTKVFSIGNTLAAALGGFAGALYAPLTLVDPSLDALLVKGFAVAAIGGLTSLPGTVIGGLLLGVCESLWVAVLPALWTPVLGYAFIIIVLLVKPAGLFGGSTKIKL